MITEAELLDGIAEYPAQLDRWLVLSDWLEDQGDPRSELARLRYLLQSEPAHADRDRWLVRQGELLHLGMAPSVPTWTNAVGGTFALILPGTFRMGSPESELRRTPDEALHTVTLTESYYLGVSPVTVGEFQKFLQATGYRTVAELHDGSYGYVNHVWMSDSSITWRTPGFSQDARHPVVCVNWTDTQAMVTWLNQAETTTGRVYSLPTEAQWEYACRAGTQTSYFWGDDATRASEFAWFSGNAERSTHPVDTKKPNPWGLRHMPGQVWEWCEDWYEMYPRESVVNPRGENSGTQRRVMRGGSWRRDAPYCRSALRGSNDSDTRCANDGFRLVVSVRKRSPVV